MATHSSSLTWRIPWTEEPGELQSMGCHKESDTTEKLTFRVCVWVCVWFFSSLFQKDWSSPLNVKGIFYCIDFVRKYTPSTCCCSVTKSCPTLCNPMNYHMLGFPVGHYLLEFDQIHWVSVAIQPSHLLLLPLWPSWSRICPQCGRPGFDSWVGKIPWRRE